MKKPTNLFKRAAIALMAASIVAATPAVASAAWETSGKGWNWIVNGQKATGWQWIDSQWYFMDTDGTMKTGWVQDGGSWYYLAPSGEMKTGWAQVDGTWYYLKSSGAMATGWVSWNGNWYRMNTSGAMITGWTSWNGGWYYMAPAGDMATGVIKVDGATYAMDASGKMQTGEVTVEGKTYTFGEDGAAVGDAPEATRTFVTGPSGATESTGTGSGTGGTTTPEKPSRPSTGGGYVPPTPDPDPGDPDPKPPVTEDRTDVAEAKTITSAAELTEFMTDIATKNYTDEVTGVVVNITDGTGFPTAVDFSKLSAKKVTIQAVPAGTTVTLNPLCLDVVVNAVCKIESATELPKVTVNVANPVGRAAATVELAAPIKVLTITAAPSVIVSKNVASAEVFAAPLTINTGATVTALTVKTGAGTIDGAGNIGTVTAEVDATIANTGTVGAVTASDAAAVTIGTAAVDTTPASGPSSVGSVITGTGAVTVNGGTVKEIESNAATITVKDGATVTDTIIATNASAAIVLPKGTTADNAPTIVAGESVTIKDTENKDIADVAAVTPNDPPAADTDYKLTKATAANPTQITLGLGTATGDDKKAVEYKIGTGAWTPLTGDVLVDVTASLSVHTAATVVDGEITKGQSSTVPVTIDTELKFTGFANDKYYYADSDQSNATDWQEVTETVESVEKTVLYWLEKGQKGGANTWKVTKGQDADAKHWTYVGTDSKATEDVFNATSVADGVNTITGLTNKMQYRVKGVTNWTPYDAETVAKLPKGTYEVSYAGTTGMAESPIVEVTVTNAPAATPTGAVTPLDPPSETTPTKGTLKLNTEDFADAVFEYRLKGSEKYEPLAFTGTDEKIALVDPGTYQIRLAETTTAGPSEPIEVTVKAYTGFVTGTDGTTETYYNNGATVEEAQWVGTDEKFYVDANSVKVKNAWVPAETQTAKKEMVCLGADGKFAADSGDNYDFGLFSVTCAINGEKTGYVLSGLTTAFEYNVNSAASWTSVESGDDVSLLFESVADTFTVKVRVKDDTAANSPERTFTCEKPATEEPVQG